MATDDDHDRALQVLRDRITRLETSVDYLRYLVDHPVPRVTPKTPAKTEEDELGDGL
jgi:hypothetical protein